MAVVALLIDVALRLRIGDALRGWCEPAECVAQARDVRARLAVGGVRALIVGPRDASGCATAPLVADVRREHPSVTVVAYCAHGAHGAHGAGGSDDIVALIRAGAHALVVRGVDDDRHAFRAALRGAEQRCTAALVLDRIRDELPAAVAPLVALYLRADGVPPSVAEAARLLGVHRKTLVNRLAAAGCPTPRALRTWCRLFLASRLLEDPGRTVESVAAQLDFDSTTGLRNALKRYTGHGASAIRAAGGLAHVLARFNAACDGHRPRRAPWTAALQHAPTGAVGLPDRSGASRPATRAPKTRASNMVDAPSAGPAQPRRPVTERSGALAAVAEVVTRVLVLAAALCHQLGAAEELFAVMQ